MGGYRQASTLREIFFLHKKYYLFFVKIYVIDFIVFNTFNNWILLHALSRIIITSIDNKNVFYNSLALFHAVAVT